MNCDYTFMNTKQIMSQSKKRMATGLFVGLQGFILFIVLNQFD